MNNFKKIKEKITFYWKQRKYHLSVFGTTSHQDWNVVLILVCAALIISSAYGYFNYRNIISEMNQESEIVVEMSKKRELEQVGAFISELELREKKFNELSGRKTE